MPDSERYVPSTFIPYLPGSAEVGVCLSAMRFYPLHSGAALRFRTYAPGLEERGIRMHVFTQSITSELTRRNSLLDDGTAAVNTTDNGNGGTAQNGATSLPVHYAQVPAGWRRQIAYLSRLVRFCQDHREEIDVVQFLHLDRKSIPWIRRLRRMGIGTVMACTMVGELSSNPFRRAMQRLDRRIPFNQVDRVVASSSVMRSYLEDLGVSTPIHVILNGVDLDRFRPPQSEDHRSRLRYQLGLDPHWRVILAVGAVSPRKGTDVLIEAFANMCHEYSNARLVLVGPRHDLGRAWLSDFRAKIDSLVSGSGAGDRIIFTGPVTNVTEYLQASDLLVFPSRREGMGNVVLEAMASGLPVITTPFVGLPEEFGRPGHTYVLSSWDVRALTADIRRLLADEPERRRLAEIGRRWVEQNADVNQSLDQFAMLYRGLAERVGYARPKS